MHLLPLLSHLVRRQPKLLLPLWYYNSFCTPGQSQQGFFCLAIWYLQHHFTVSQAMLKVMRGLELLLCI